MPASIIARRSARCSRGCISRGRSYSGYLENPRGMKWWRGAAAEVRPLLDRPRQQLLDEELRFQALHRFPDLPRGPVHADLFRDNVLFEEGHVSGVIDFYFAGVDCLLYDVAGVRE
jgi:homoserine kinase type II